MNIYHLKIIYPGMSSIRDIVNADGYNISEGGYNFFINKDLKPGNIVKDRIVTCVYPVGLTIIERIEYTDKS